MIVCVPLQPITDYSMATANQKQRYPVKLVRIGTIKKIKNLSVGKDVKKLESLCAIG